MTMVDTDCPAINLQKSVTVSGKGIWVIMNDRFSLYDCNKHDFLINQPP